MCNHPLDHPISRSLLTNADDVITVMILSGVVIKKHT